ncbi:MAG: twin-arginine translocation signal domain-containing protein [Rhodospirillales bacterium]
MSAVISPAVKNPSRRKFLKTSAVAGGGLMLGVALPSAFAAKDAVTTSMPNAWIKIGSDNTVTIITSHSEMGQACIPRCRCWWRKSSKSTSERSRSR